jgi:tetratricopeptide (TPR) repeat protein
MRLVLSVWLALLLPVSARAEWLEVSSTHFVVYADDSERNVRRFSEQLELYHQAMSVVTGWTMPDPSPSNRVTVFVVKNVREVQNLASDRRNNIAGFYIPRAGGSVAFVPQVRTTSGQLDFSMVVLLHEYAHHFTISNSSFPMPRWMGEGSAEFFAAARFTSDGGISLGLPSRNNYLEIIHGADVTVEELLDPDMYEKRRPRRFDSFYGKSWLLYHYLTFEPARKGQLAEYWRRMTAGASSREAALQTFGSFAELERDLARYLRRPRVMTIVFQPRQLEIGRIDVRRLSAGEAAIMPAVMRSRRGVDEKQAAEVLIEARAVAARYPADAAVLAALAEAEYDAGNDAQAIAAADAALALDRQRANAYVQKGYALFRRAASAENEDMEAAYVEAVAPFVALNRIENDHPLPLIYYYNSFSLQGRTPPEVAIRGIERAAELAPFDLALRMMVASQQIGDARFDHARYNLVPIAYSPHPTAMSAGARAALERMDAGETDDIDGLLALLGTPEEPEPEPEEG